MIVAFCIVITEGPRHRGGESFCSFYKPKIEFPKLEEPLYTEIDPSTPDGI